MELISIIVPIYNVEDYLSRCIQSVLSQTYLDFELILVDDGATDSSPIICNQWLEKDERIKVIHKRNGGLSDARNAGIQLASGEYIVFIDSDDWVTQDYLHILYESLERSHCDIVECGIICTDAAEKPSKPSATSLNIENFTNSVQVYNTEEALCELIEDHIFHQYVWNKIYRRQLLEGIFFEKGKINEDEFWTYQVFGRAKKIGKVEIPLYYYFQRPTSIMGMKYSINRLDALEAKGRRQDYINQNYPSLSSVAAINLIESCIYQGQMSLYYLSGKELRVAKEKIKAYVHYHNLSFSEYRNCRFSERLWITMAKYAFWTTCKIKNLLKKGI